MPTCTRCGAPVDDRGEINEEQGYAYCEACEAAYQASLAIQYPHGQCQECGAKNFEYVRPDGSTEIRAWHAEGQCPRWVDWNGLDEDEDETEALTEFEASEAGAKALAEGRDRIEDEETRRNSDAWQALLEDYCARLRAGAGIEEA